MEKERSPFGEVLTALVASINLNIEMARVLTESQRKRVKKSYTSKNKELLEYMKRYDAMIPTNLIDSQVDSVPATLVRHYIHHADLLGGNRTVDNGCEHCQRPTKT